MASALESIIMSKIGLAQHFSYYNGSGDCERIRKLAADRLEGAIIDAAVDGGKVASPHPKLIAVVKRIAEVGDESESVLTKTWKAASDAIRAHISSVGLGYEERAKYLDGIADELAHSHLPAGAREIASGAPSQPKDYSRIEVVGPATARLKRGGAHAGRGLPDEGDSGGGFARG